MEKLHFTYKEIDSEHAIAELAKLFDSPSQNGIIRIAPGRGTGIIKKIPLDSGLSMRIWNFNVNEPISFHKLVHNNLKQGKFFHICYLLTSSSVEIRSGIPHRLNRIPTGMNTVFFSGDAEIEFTIEANKEMNAIDLSATYSWLMEAFPDDEIEMRLFINNLHDREHPTMLLESLSPDEYRVVSDLFKSGSEDLNSHLHIKAEVLLLIADFFKKIAESKKEELWGKILYFDKMVIAEKTLKENLHEIFPGIKMIAKKISLSESTLKRYFKAVFHKSIHEYYLELKMEEAKQLLLEKNITVNEVAAILQYEKVSSFIESFKKHHGYSPGRLKRKAGL